MIDAVLQEAKSKLNILTIQHGRITNMEVVQKHKLDIGLGFLLDEVPDYLRVCVSLKPTNDSDIKVEVWLPVNNWNGSFLGTGNGGSAGTIDVLSLNNGVRLGFASANTDMGTSPNPDALIGKKERWKDFGYRSTHLMTVVAKQIIQAYYEKEIEYSYFSGGSTGGQQGMMEAQRFPKDYNGILVCAPANNRIHLHVGFVWDWLAVAQCDQTKFTLEQAKKITERILECYGKEGGALSGEKFMSHPDQLIIDTAIFKKCDFLSKEQVNALKLLYQGPVDRSNEKRIFRSLVTPGSEAGSLGLVDRSDKDKFAEDFFYLFRWIFGKDYDFTCFDFEKDTMRADETLGEILSATDADLSQFQEQGGKLLMLHGTADPIIPYTQTMDYYDKVVEKQGSLEKTMDFCRLFLIPGMAHNFSGPGLQDIMLGARATPKDKEHLGILALKSWVETKKAPEQLLPVAFQDNNALNGFLQETYVYERPVYPYPWEAEYIEGNPYVINNFKKCKRKS